MTDELPGTGWALERAKYVWNGDEIWAGGRVHLIKSHAHGPNGVTFTYADGGAWTYPLNHILQTRRPTDQ